jgi:hypothetical protein
MYSSIVTLGPEKQAAAPLFYLTTVSDFSAAFCWVRSDSTSGARSSQGTGRNANVSKFVLYMLSALLRLDAICCQGCVVYECALPL